MRQLIKTLGKTQISYFQKGEAPSLLIHSGTHGDEYGVIESVKLAVEKYENQLPDFIFVPVVSPTAVANKTRFNGDKVDLNRSFVDNSPISEVEANLQIIRGVSIETMVTFHEDTMPDSKFYLYDTGWGMEELEEWKNFKRELSGIGVELLNGTDDPNDPTLNFSFYEGYHFWPLHEGDYQDGTIDSWLSQSSTAKKLLIPEVPSHLDQERKNKIVDLFFHHLLLKA